MIVAFISAWGLAVTSVFNRKLKTIDYTLVMVYHGFIGVILAILFIVIEGLVKSGQLRFYSLEQYLFLFGAATWDTIGCYSITIAYQSDSSGFVSLLGYAIIVYGFLSDVIFFDEQILPLQFAGAMIIFVATFIVAVYKVCEAHRERCKL